MSLELRRHLGIESEETVTTGEIMKRRLPAGVFAMAVCLMVCTSGASVSATAYDVVSSTLDMKARNDDCMGWVQSVDVMGVGRRDACFVHGRSLAGTVWTPIGVRLVIQDGWTGKYGLVTGICDSGLGCQYAHDADRLIVRQYGAQGYAGLLMYDDFLNRLSPKITVHGIEYVFDGSPADFSLSDSDGRLLHVGSFAVSSNGRWVAAEVVNKGIVRVDTETLSVGRVFAPGYQYGRGMDPRHHLAITPEGDSIVITGLNGGLNIVSVNDGCIEPLIFPLADMPTSHQRCSVFASVQSSVPPVRYYHHPSFSDDQTTLLLRGTTYAGQQYTFRLHRTGASLAPRVDVLAMGDSFTSGEGETDDRQYAPHTNTQDERCHVSLRSYPYLLASLSGWSRPLSVACSGARMVDIVGTPEYRGQQNRLDKAVERGESDSQQRSEAIVHRIPGRIPQADFLKHVAADRVIVGVGGNDAGITAKISACAGAGTCRWATPSYREAVRQEATRLLPSLTNLYKHIAAQAPAAELIVTGYPVAIQPDGRCDAVTATLFSKQEQQFMNASIRLLNDVIQIATNAADVQFAPLETAFQNHALCDATETPAMNGLRFGKEVGLFASTPELNVIGSESFHPTPFGHTLIAHELYRQQNDHCNADCHDTADEQSNPYWQHVATESAVDFIRSLPIRLKEAGVLEVTIPSELRLQQQSLKVEVDGRTIETVRTDNAADYLIMAIELPKSHDRGGFLATVTGLTQEGDRVELYDWIPREEAASSDGHTVNEEQPGNVLQSKDISNPHVAALEPTIRHQAVLGSEDAFGGQQHSTIKPSENTTPFWLNPLSYAFVLLVVGIMAVWLLFVHLLRK